MKFYIAGPMKGIKEHNFPAFDEARDLLVSSGHDAISPADLTRTRWGGKTPRDMDITPTVYASLLKEDFSALLTCDAIILIDGWENSNGARSEAFVAFTAGLKVYRLVDKDNGPKAVMLPQTREGIISMMFHAAFGGAPTDAGVISATTPSTTAPAFTADTILKEADRLVSGERQTAYGHPLDNFRAIADMWTPVIENRLRKLNGREVSDAVRCDLEPEDASLMMVLLKVARELNAPKDDNLIDAAGYVKVTKMIAEERTRRIDEYKTASYDEEV